MPTLDVSDLLLDPDMCEEVTVLRRHEVVNSFGESVVDTTSIPVMAVVNPASQPQMQRMADGQVQPNLISVHSAQIRFVGPADGNQPDVVVWRGRAFVVTKTNDFSHYGTGFTHAECSSMDYLDSLT